MCSLKMFSSFRCATTSVQRIPKSLRLYPSAATVFYGRNCTTISCSALIHPDDGVESAISVASSVLGKTLSFESKQALVQKLTDNWYTSAKDIADMSEEESISLGFPLRLKSTIEKALVVDEEGSSSHPDGIKASETLVVKDVVQDITPQVEDVQDVTLEERVCPRFNRFGFHTNAIPKVVPTRSRITKYSISKKELTPQLKEEFDRLIRFGTERFYGAQSEPIAMVTAEKYTDHLRGFLGYLANVDKVPLEELSLQALVPSSGRQGVIPAFNYTQWLIKERNIAVRTELLVLRSVLFVAKFVYHDQSQIVPGSGDKSYSDLDVVKELRALINSRRKASKVAPRVADEKTKWMDWNEYLFLVQELRKETGALKVDSRGNTVRREDKDIAWSLQKYLIFAILSCIPDRQRTIRELKIGTTLFKEEGDRYVIRHGPADYKTGRAYGERAPLYISTTINPELEAYINTYRSALQPKHEYLFTQANGQPLTDKSLYKLFWTTSFRISGKRLTPHMVRDVVITHLRGTDASERELEALAIYMGHSVSIQKSTYDRRSQQEKVQPAVNLLASITGTKDPQEP